MEAKKFLTPAVVPRRSPGCPQPSMRPSTTLPDLSPASSTGWVALPLTPPDPRAILHGDTRPPERQGLSLCKGKAERDPRITGGLVSSIRGNASSPARSAARMRPPAANGQQLLLPGLLAHDPCVLPATYGSSQCGGQHIAPTRRGRRAAASVCGPGTSPSTPGARARIEGCAGRPLCLERTPRRRPGSRIGPALAQQQRPGAAGRWRPLVAGGWRDCVELERDIKRLTATSPRSPT
jgi:hypothetical protein